MKEAGLAIFRSQGLGARLNDAANVYLDQYVYSPEDNFADHDPTDFEREMMRDMIAGMFADEKFCDILQAAARGMKAGGRDPEGPA